MKTKKLALHLIVVVLFLGAIITGYTSVETTPECEFSSENATHSLCEVVGPETSDRIAGAVLLPFYLVIALVVVLVLGAIAIAAILSALRFPSWFRKTYIEEEEVEEEE